MNKVYLFIGTITVGIALLIGILVGQNLSKSTYQEMLEEDVLSESLLDSIEIDNESSDNDDLQKLSKKEVELSNNIYRNEEWGIEIDIPQEWIDKGYYVRTKGESDVFGDVSYVQEYLFLLADFEDWEGFELLTLIRHTPSFREQSKIAQLAGSRYQEILREIDNTTIENGTFWDLADRIYLEKYGHEIHQDYKAFGGPILIWPEESIFYQDEEFIYIITNYGHDAPNEYFDDKWNELYPKDLRTMIRKI
jgi:hypothetical protein